MTTVTIIYKSGAKVQIRCSSFRVRVFKDGRREYAWTDASPDPLFIGADDIAAVYEGKA